MDCSLPGSSVHGDSPGKNTGVGCHFLFQGIFPTQESNQHLLCLLHWQVGSLPLEPPGKLIKGKWKWKVVSNSLQPHGLYSPWNSPGQNTGVDSLSLPQGNLPKSGMEPRSPTLQGILYQLSYQGSPIKGEAAKNHQTQDERDQRSSSRLEDPPPKMRLRKCKLCPHSNLVRDPTFDPHQIL